MKAPATVFATCAVVIAFAAAVLGAASAPGPVGQVANVSAPGKPALDSIVEEPYALTWQKDPSLKSRDPFETVLHAVGGDNVKRPDRIAAPRTPGEEAEFTAKALVLVQEAEGALGEADYTGVKTRLATLHEMAVIKLTTQSAKDSMTEVVAKLADLEGRYVKIRARAALTEALQVAALMQGYFESSRYGEVITASDKVAALDNDEGLRNAEVAEAGAAVASKCAELKKRSEVRLEFEKMKLKVDAVSHFPQGRSFAIVNGEVYGEGGSMAPELVVASVADNMVVFHFKGEEISLGLAQ